MSARSSSSPSPPRAGSWSRRRSSSPRPVSSVRKTGNERGYRGEIVGLDNVEVAFVSSSEIASYLKTGRAHSGVTGEDLIREQMSDADERVEFLTKLGFGHADVVVAVPNCWIDVRTMADSTRSRFRSAARTAAGIASPPSTSI